VDDILPQMTEAEKNCSLTVTMSEISAMLPSIQILVQASSTPRLWVYRRRSFVKLHIAKDEAPNRPCDGSLRCSLVVEKLVCGEKAFERWLKIETCRVLAEAKVKRYYF